MILRINTYNTLQYIAIIVTSSSQKLDCNYNPIVSVIGLRLRRDSICSFILIPL
jgi:hypothetical protein